MASPSTNSQKGRAKSEKRLEFVIFNSKLAHIKKILSSIHLVPDGFREFCAGLEQRNSPNQNAIRLVGESMVPSVPL